jgi:hypothetical protein
LVVATLGAYVGAPGNAVGFKVVMADGAYVITDVGNELGLIELAIVG